MKPLLLASLVSSTLALTGVASAEKIVSGANGVSEVGAGVKEVGIESMFVLSSKGKAETTAGAKDDTSNMRVSLLGGVFFHYFVADNLYLTGNVGALYRSDSTSVGGASIGKASSVGFLGTVGAGFLARLGGGMFLVPAVGVGGYSLNTDTTSKVVVGTSSSDVTVSSGEAGLAVRLELGFVFYSSAKFNLFARPQALVLLGTSKLKNQPAGASDQSSKTTTIDGGFDVGVSLVF